MQQRNKLEQALQELELSTNPNDKKAHAWLAPIVTTIDGVPKANSYRITNWFNMARCSITAAKQCLTLWLDKDKPEIKQALKQPGTWKVILLAVQQTEDFHPDIMPQILGFLIKDQALEAQRAFMESQAGRPVSIYELQQLLNDIPSSYGDAFDIRIKSKCALIKEQVKQQITGFFEYALFIAKDLDTENESHVNRFCSKLAKLSENGLGNIATSSSKELFFHNRHNLLHNRMLENGYSEKEITNIILKTDKLLTQEFQAAEKLSNNLAKRYKNTALEQELLRSKLLDMFATSILLRDNSADYKSTIITAAENLTGQYIAITPSRKALLDTIVQKQQEIMQTPYSPHAEDELTVADSDTEDEGDLLFGNIEKHFKNAEQAMVAAETFSPEQKVLNTTAMSANRKTFITELLQGGFLSSSFAAIPTAHEKTQDTIVAAIMTKIKLLSSHGLSNFGLDFTADTPWPTNQKDSIQRHQKYHHDPEYSSVLAALEHDIPKLFPFLKEASLQNKIINLTGAILDHKEDDLYFLYKSILDILTPTAGQEQELKLAEALAEGDTPKHISNLILAITHERLAIKGNRALFKITADNNKPLLQMLEPVLTILLRESLKIQETRAPLLKLFQELHNERDPANNMLTLLKPPHNMTRLEVTKFLALSPQEQAEFETSADTMAALKAQVVFNDASLKRRNNAILELLNIDAIQETLITKVAPKLVESETPKDMTSLIINILKSGIFHGTNKLDSSILNYLEHSLPDLLEVVLNDPELQTKIVAILSDSYHNRKISKLSLFTSIANIVFDPKVREILVKRPDELLKVIENILGITISAKELEDIAKALPEAPKGQLSQQDMLNIIHKIPLTTIFNVHRKITFHKDSLLFFKLTYPIHLVVLILCLIAIAPVLVTANNIMPPKNTTEAIEFKPDSMSVSRENSPSNVEINNSQTSKPQ